MKSYIAIDWGSSNLRAYFIQANDRTNQFSSNKGVKNIVDVSEYPLIIKEIITQFGASASVPILMGGMVGSANGWVNTEYLHCPFSLNSISSQLIPFPEQSEIPNSIYLFPGLCISDSSTGTHGVMRGEEVQLIGALSQNNFDFLILPGTHSKWVQVHQPDAGAAEIRKFSTIMTGELYEVLMSNSLLGVDSSIGFSDEGFDKGLSESIRSNAVIESLFTARSRRLLNALTTEEVPGYLSGMLIGNEVKSQLEKVHSDMKIGVIASSTLTDLYTRAFELYNLKNVEFLNVENTTISGFNLIANESFT